MTVPSRPTPSRFSVTAGGQHNAFRLGIYGPEGIGKTSLARLCPGIVFANVENAVEYADTQYVRGINVPDDPAASWINLRSWIQSLSNGVYCIDSVTRAEDWCTAHVIKNKKSNEGKNASDSIEDFKYKAGALFVVEEFRRFISDIDNAYLRGASFVMIAHNRVAKIKNPDGSDFIRNEPRLFENDKLSNILQWVQFLDELLFIDLDKSVDKGKATGYGSRQIYLDTSPTRFTKARTLPKQPISFEEGHTEIWKLLGVE